MTEEWLRAVIVNASQMSGNCLFERFYPDTDTSPGPWSTARCAVCDILSLEPLSWMFTHHLLSWVRTKEADILRSMHLPPAPLL